MRPDYHQIQLLIPRELLSLHALLCVGSTFKHCIIPSRTLLLTRESMCFSSQSFNPVGRRSGIPERARPSTYKKKIEKPRLARLPIHHVSPAAAWMHAREIRTGWRDREGGCGWAAVASVWIRGSLARIQKPEGPSCPSRELSQNRGVRVGLLLSSLPLRAATAQNTG